ncbi:hypothetical protein VTK73DRAFT_4918 [Phialemonium thermophilum]|uniref:DUF7924 domain-containing protein n=1 Tax=Phialemonium thermophilum TaxID=223376 RepID=A0ABR3WRG9_9PEZI
MSSRVSKARTRRPRLRLSRALQQVLLKAVAETPARGPVEDPDLGHGAGRHVDPSGAESRGPSPEAVGTKRRLDPTEADTVPTKRARRSQSSTQEDESAEQRSNKTTTSLLQPTPRPPQHPYASFLRDFVDPFSPGPSPASSTHALVFEWLESIDSDRERYSRSDSLLLPPRSGGDDVPVSKQRARSAPTPEMGPPARDTDGFAVPPTPVSTASRPYAPTEDSSSTLGSVRHPYYRRNNLNSNGIFVQRASARLPDRISSHVATLQAERDSPDPSSEQMDGYMRELEILAEGCTEADVEGFFEASVFPKTSDRTYGRDAGLELSKSALMSSHLVPDNPESPFKVTRPKPDLLYGYSGAQGDGAFTPPQFLAQTALHPRNVRFAEATAQGLRFPFFAIEFKAAGGTQGDLWVAANQCAGASAACLNAVDQLNAALPDCPDARRVDDLSYAVAVDNNTAQLYISWKEDHLRYYLQRVGAFLLCDPDHFRSFRRQVRNILDWGKDARLAQIRAALDTILEESRRTAAKQAKSRPAPSAGSARTTSAKKKPKASSSRSSNHNSSSRSNSVPGPSGKASADDPAPRHDAYDEPSCPPRQPPSFADASDYAALDDLDGGLVPLEYQDPEDGQPDLALPSFGWAADEALAGFVADASTGELPTAADGGWTWE